MSSFPSFRPAIALSLAEEFLALRSHEGSLDGPVFPGPLNASISSSRSQMSLNATDWTRRRNGRRQLCAKDWRKRKADEVVERAAGEIGIDQGRIDLAGCFMGLEHRVAGDGVEDNTRDSLPFTAPFFP